MSTPMNCKACDQSLSNSDLPYGICTGCRMDVLRQHQGVAFGHPVMVLCEDDGCALIRDGKRYEWIPARDVTYV
jgi:hypothetical protein